MVYKYPVNNLFRIVLYSGMLECVESCFILFIPVKAIRMLIYINYSAKGSIFLCCCRCYSATNLDSSYS